MWNAIISLFSITVGLYQGDFREIQPDPMLLTMIYLFLLVSVVLLLNLLIAQLNQTYEYINKERYCQLATLFFYVFIHNIQCRITERIGCGRPCPQRNGKRANFGVNIQGVSESKWGIAYPDQFQTP